MQHVKLAGSRKIVTFRIRGSTQKLIPILSCTQMTKIASKNRRRYFDRKNGIYIDCFGNEWTFMEEVKDITRFKELCEQHGVRCLIKCMQHKWFKKSNGRKGFDCPYQLLFVRTCQQMTENKFGYIFHRGLSELEWTLAI